jgi:DNA-binding CsgD family transcriptional regulator
MSALILTPSDLRRVRRLLSVEDQVSDRSRWRAAMLALSDLIPCDMIGVGVTDATGCSEQELDLSPWDPSGSDPQVCDGPVPTGIQHLGALPDSHDDKQMLRHVGIRDVVRVGFPLGRGRVVQVYLDRRTTTFEPRDLALLTMLEPALGRLLRPAAGAGSLTGLSDAERRVLELVAQGGSNQDVAVQLRVSEATVRKHLEHSYRKLGVANRTAAAALVYVGAGS